MSEEARIVDVDGKLVLIDPVAHAVMQAVERHNCRGLLAPNAERIQHYVGRVEALGRSAADTVIVLLDVDDEAGAVLAELLVPGQDWQAIRDRGEIPIARGLAAREGIQDALEQIDPVAAKDLREATALSIVVVSRGVAAVFSS